MTSGGLVETAFYNRTYDEALEMTVEARDYVADVLITDRDSAAFGERCYFDCEALAPDHPTQPDDGLADGSARRPCRRDRHPMRRAMKHAGWVGARSASTMI